MNNIHFKIIKEGGGQLTDDEEDADIILQDQDSKSTSSNSYSLKYVIDSYFWEKLQNKEDYKIKPNESNIISNSIFEEIKYVNSTRNGLRFAIK